MPGQPSRVLFAPMRTTLKRSLVTRAGALLDRAGLKDVVAGDDVVAVKLHFGERGNTGFVQPVFLREVVSRIKAAGGKPFLTDANTLYRGERANAVDHRIPHQGDERLFWDRSNWQPSCVPCNSRKCVEQEGGFGR